jgi:peptide/nickel transport system permease protein
VSRLEKIAAWLLGGIVFACVVGPWFLPDPIAIDPAATYAGPSAAHPFGTDDAGRDVLARLLVGGRVSLAVAFCAAAASTVIGGGVGTAAGYLGGRVDRIVMRIVEGAIAIPKLPLFVVLAAIELPGDELRLVLIMASFGWMTSARLARARAKQLAEAGHVIAARALGAKELHVLLKHVLPGAAGTIVLAATLDVGEYVVYESVLSFLGLGVQPPAPSWGAMLQSGLTYARTAPHLFILPGLFTMAAIAASLTVGEALAGRLDPRRHL